MRVERFAQPRLDLVGITAGGQLDHVRISSGGLGSTWATTDLPGHSPVAEL
jgi:hypothetical protein